MKKYIAYVTDKNSKQKKFIEDDSYTSKKAFAEDLRRNGYAVHYIATPETLNEVSDIYNKRREYRNDVARNTRAAAKAHNEATTEEPTQEVKTMRFRKEWFCAQTKKIEKDNMPNITRFDADVEFAVVNCTENQESAAIRKAVERFVELLKKRDDMAVLVDTLEMMLNCNEYDQRSNYNEIRNGGGAYEVEIDRYTDTELNIYVRICESCDDAQEVEKPKEAEEENQAEEKPTADSVFIAEMVEALKYFKRVLWNYIDGTRYERDISGDFWGAHECGVILRFVNDRLKAQGAEPYYKLNNDFDSLTECFEEIMQKFEYGDERTIEEIISEYNFS